MSDHHPKVTAGSVDPSGEPSNAPVPRMALVGPGHEESRLTRALRTLFGGKTGTIRSDLTQILAASPSETGFSPRESTMLRGILGLRERRVEDVMVPRADVVAVQQGIPIGELLKVFANAAHSRLVVYDETLDDAMGMVHIRDLISWMTRHAADAATKSPTNREEPSLAGLELTAIDLSMPLSAAKLMRDLLFAPPSMPVLDLLAKMQATRIHLALVVDEYGGSDGVVSMEDIVEQIVGDIGDEHDEDLTPAIIRQSDGSYLADARASLEDVSSIVGPEFDVSEIAKDVDTLAGYIATRIGRVPVRGELVPGPGRFEIEILDADPRRAKKLKIYRNGEPLNRQSSVGSRSTTAPPANNSGLQIESSIASNDAPESPASDAQPPNSARRP
ncbi:MAG TPA: hemolysin family protein [Xanthobacteraceae bacterium]|jgi:CBS domain containing-hemolysin-like protein|nr:hemolysin family protein [Xanthobacteraceae bacterium]